jgi:hypothetical protein
MKIDSSVHKKQVGGVVRCDTLEEAKAEYIILTKKFKEQIVIQEEIKGIEIILGIKEDNVFGKLLLLGFGGESLEKEDVAFRALPIKRGEIKKTLKSLRNYSKIRGLAIEKLLTMIEIFLVIVDTNDIIEADLNPIILTKKDAIIVDARIERG